MNAEILVSYLPLAFTGLTLLALVAVWAMWRHYSLTTRQLEQSLKAEIRAHHAALRSARAEAARFRSVVEQAAVGIAILDADGHWVIINQPFCDMLGYCEDELRSMDFQSITHEDDLQRDVELAAQVISGLAPRYQMEKRYIRKDGAVIWAMLYVGRIAGTVGQPAQFISVVVDITERKRAEAEVRAISESLEAQVAQRTEELRMQSLDVQRQNDALTMITEMTGLLPSVEDEGDVVQIVTQYLPRLFPNTLGAICLQVDGERYEPFGQWGGGNSSGAIQPQQCWGLRRLRQHRAESVGDSMRCAHIAPEHRHRARSCVPLQARGEIIGLLTLSWDADGVTPGANLLTTIAEQVSLAIINLRLRAELRQQAFVDSLTGLYNRRQFEENYHREWRRAKRSGQTLSVLMIDVDCFKAYNDLYGHRAGDAALQRVATAISGSIRRPPDLAARLGGEEFIVLLPDTHNAGASDVAQRLILAVRDLGIQHQGGVGGHLSVSVGVASAIPSTGMAETELTDFADRGLYAAKAAGRDRWINLAETECAA